MEQLSPDALRILALNLPLKQILALCQINKRFRSNIYDNKQFWQDLFLREIKETVDIPPDANIEWYKEKIKAYPDTKKIANLIREYKVHFSFIQQYDEKEIDNLNSFDIIENLKELNCENNQLILLPPMPKLKILNCGSNLLISLPSMPNLEQLFCGYNQLTLLPSMPNLEIIHCQNNQITTLPPMLNLKYLGCIGNPLPFFALAKWKRYWNK